LEISGNELCRSKNFTRNGIDIFARYLGYRSANGNGSDNTPNVAKHWGGHSSNTKDVFLIIQRVPFLPDFRRMLFESVEAGNGFRINLANLKFRKSLSISSFDSQAINAFLCAVQCKSK